MDYLHQIDSIIQKSRNQLIQYEFLADHLAIPESELHERYRELVKHHKELVGMVGELLQCNRQLKKKNMELHKLCKYDVLTGVHTRRFLLEALRLEIDRIRNEDHETVVALVDVDDFKSLNDRYGHQIGDICLKKIAHTMRSKLRSYDIIGRYGGEEFIIILPDTSESNGKDIIARIRKSIESITMPCFGNSLHLSASFGYITIRKNSTITMDEIICGADKALKIAKQTGKNKAVVYDPSVIGAVWKGRD
ncbi:diguanylate cyclase (GGDEF) domain-containing protein [Desulfosporosinus orientis DSM 765]|uniref:Diguanylate cyclase (GGDEF) domain-containing protein n=1 Tax=Desulfosporosinus orientis (strain ATCC 19365 / DSM 765 / NCIMB 8382 / VKM B-1628 / Singapore I) TaxID=768706 RepID=G7WBS3_DESOD|nr:GGDEF domain-containing protein [Desulfosporosinus orientis]AET69320.1 diguanylate cyclase (GGDEF) domain-containing protein [Desulfosporosinus orientis DSM 765]